MNLDNKVFILDKSKVDEFLRIKPSKKHNAIIEKRAKSLSKILKDEIKHS